ncbi:MAG: hypothetical protein EBQ59_09425, partial [Verrucomicrobia bacterium]|nr:hypothetical protein [Verrucomicrobiota bacterium]
MRFTADGSLGNSANTIVIDGGRLATANSAVYTIASARGIAVGDNADTGISTPGTGTLTYNGIIANKSGETGSWAKQGGGTLELGGVSTYTGDTFINNGVLKITTGNDRLPTGTVVSLGQAASANLGIFDLNGQSQQIAGLVSTTGTNAAATKNTVTSATAATLTITVADGVTKSYGDGTTLTNSGVITGALSLVKTGSGTQVLGDANTYTGTTTINGGILSVGSIGDGGVASGNLGSATNAAANLVLNGGTLKYTGTGTTSSNRNFTLGTS